MKSPLLKQLDKFSGFAFFRTTTSCYFVERGFSKNCGTLKVHLDLSIIPKLSREPSHKYVQFIAVVYLQ